MAQATRDSRLETRGKRLDLKKGERYHAKIGPGLTLIYRRPDSGGSGSWSAKLLAGEKYKLRVLGAADDNQNANGVDVLNWTQAQEKARNLAEEVKVNRGLIIKPMTVGEAAREYLIWFRDHRKSFTSTETSVRAHILPTLGEIQLDALTSTHIREWLEATAAKPARLHTRRFAPQAHRQPAQNDEEKRARRATANRVFAILRAILNRAFQKGRVASDTAWRKTKPFKKVDEARIRFLTEDEAARLVNASAPSLRPLVQGALLTGCRFGELARLLVGDVDLQAGRLYVSESKSGKPRHVPLNAQGISLFQAATTGKTGEALVFVKTDDKPWGPSHYRRLLAQACRVAKIAPAVSFHELRHTYASMLVQRGVPLLDVSKLLGHADTRITAKHYAHLADRQLEQAVAKLPSFGDTAATNVASIRAA